MDAETKTDSQRMMALFEGYSGAHGTHGEMLESATKGGKQEIKKTARTVREPVTDERWQKHLSGEVPLGIIPIREDSNCLWGCIDVDQYDINLGAVAAEIEKRKLPMVVCRTKSGGAHVFLFLSSPSPAAHLRAKLRQVAASMGWGTSEIFPKQNQVLSDKGDLGNWLNMPYLGGNKTSRYGVKLGGGGMSLSEFLGYAEKRRVVLDEVSDPQEPDDESLSDGPPCLQHLATVGFPDGSRNNGLFGLAVFAKKKFPSRWREVIEKYNRDFMVPPLTAEEVISVASSVEKKDYQYKCKDHPCVDYCNVVLCKARKFGVGGSGKWPTISGMSKLDAGENTLWFLDIEDERIELSTEQLLNYRLFQKVCMEQLTVAFLPLGSNEWMGMVSEAMANATIIEASPEVTVRGHFMELLEEFLTNRHMGDKEEDILMGKPFQDTGEKKFYFRLQDLMGHLDKAQFRAWGRNVVGKRLEEMGGRRFFNIRGKGVNTYYIENRYVDVGAAALPPSRRSPV